MPLSPRASLSVFEATIIEYLPAPGVGPTFARRRPASHRWAIFTVPFLSPAAPIARSTIVFNRSRGQNPTRRTLAAARKLQPLWRKRQRSTRYLRLHRHRPTGVDYARVRRPPDIQLARRGLRRVRERLFLRESCQPVCRAGIRRGIEQRSGLLAFRVRFDRTCCLAPCPDCARLRRDQYLQPGGQTCRELGYAIRLERAAGMYFSPATGGLVDLSRIRYVRLVDRAGSTTWVATSFPASRETRSAIRSSIIG